MKITIVTSGSRGDVQPYVALGVGLQEAGYQVRIATHKPFADFAGSYGLEFIPLEGDPQEILDSDTGKKMLEGGSNGVRALSKFMELYKKHLQTFLDNLLEACRGAELIIFSITSFPCYYIAIKLGIPSIGAYLQPWTSTRYFPNIFLQQKNKYGGTFNLMTYFFVEQLLWHPIRKLINNWLKKTLQLPPIPFMGNFRHLVKTKHPVIYGFSQTVIPKPADWGYWLTITGYWFLEQPPDWQPSKELLDFLDSGPPPVYIGFGSMISNNPEKAGELALRALTLSKKRGILLSGWGGINNSDWPDNVFLIDSVPHDWLFPQMEAVVHHGGAGTTSAGLRAGIPSIIVPFFADQPFWANRVYEIGAGTKSIPRENLTAENLAAAIKVATSDKEIQTRASRIGQRIRSEDGIANAIKVLECFK